MKIKLEYNKAEELFEIQTISDPIDLIVSLISIVMFLFALRVFLKADSIHKEIKETNRLLRKIANEPTEEEQRNSNLSLEE